MTEELKLSEQNIVAMKAEFDRNRTRRLDKIPITRVSQVCAVGPTLQPAELRNIEREGNDGAGMIDFERLLALTSLQLQARQGTNFYRTVFNMVDTDGQGYLSFDQLRQLIHKLVQLAPEMRLTEPDIDELVAIVKQKNKTNKITYDDFYALMAE